MIAIGDGSSMDTANAIGIIINNPQMMSSMPKGLTAVTDVVKKLYSDVGIPSNLTEIVKAEDIQFLAESTYSDTCRQGNPKETSVEDIVKLLYYLK